jgi:PAS domain S-box-containing protein
MDADGWVLGSTQDGEVGQRIDMAQLGKLPSPAAEGLGQFLAGRNLPMVATAAVSRPGVGFIPLVRAVQAQGGQTIYLVALLNPDSFSNFQVLTLNAPQSSAYLLSYSGQILASSGAGARPPGVNVGDHAIFKRYLPSTEFSVFVDEGITPDRQVVAYRVSKTRSLVSVVEQPYTSTIGRWFDSTRWFALATAFAVFFILALTWLMHRALAARLRAQNQLELARQDVVDRERDLRILVRSVQELIFRTDADGCISYVNDRWFALSGQSADLALGQSLTDLVEPEDISQAADLFNTESGNGVRHASVRMRSFYGVLHRLDIAVVPLREGDGITGFAGSAVDVTERYAAQLALEHQLDFIALLLEISPLPVSTCDEQGRFVTVNRAWEEFMGFTREHVVGRTYASVMPAADAQEQSRQDAELWKSGGTLRSETLLNHRDGSRRNVVVTKILVNGDDYHPSSLLSTMMDVSEFREAQRAIQMARDAAEESSRTKSEFIANISHELRTPLQSILGFSELGVMRGKDQPKLAGMFGDIHTSGERMLALVNDLLDVSKIESAVGAITLERIDLRGVVEQVVREFRPQLAARQLHLEVDLGPGALVAKADPVRFAQVVRNVVANAVKFSPVGSRIEVRGRLLVDEREVCIRFRDHGVGIPEKELETIFDAFVQSSSTKNGSGGTGLGLAICKKIMAAHGGRIVAHNIDGGGAEFQVCLPARMHLDRDSTY